MLSTWLIVGWLYVSQPDLEIGAILDWGWSSLELGRLENQGCNRGAVTDPTPLLVLSMTPNPLNFCHHATHCPLDDHCLCLMAATVCNLVVSSLNSIHVAGPLLQARSKFSILLFVTSLTSPAADTESLEPLWHIPTCKWFQYAYVAVGHCCTDHPSTTNVISCSCKMKKS